MDWLLAITWFLAGGVWGYVSKHALDDLIEELLDE